MKDPVSTFQDVLSTARQMNGILNKSEETWVDQTLFVTISSDFEKGLMEAGVKNIVTVTDDLVARSPEKVLPQSTHFIVVLQLNFFRTN